jgi:hypothetical protein
MSTTSDLSGALRRVLLQPTGGVAGLVDELLAVCREHGLQLEWQANRCRVRPVGGAWQDVTDVPLRKSVFRAVLARMAALCNDGGSGPVSPYGGQGEIKVGANPATVFRVAFINTPGEQRLELAPAGLAALGNTDGEPGADKAP